MSADYPANWPTISYAVRVDADNRCVRCGHPNDPAGTVQCDRQCRHKRDWRRRLLTVHHLDGDKSNCKKWNLAALCQVCHLFIQAAYVPGQLTLDGGAYEKWLEPYEDARKRWLRRDQKQRRKWRQWIEQEI